MKVEHPAVSGFSGETSLTSRGLFPKEGRRQVSIKLHEVIPSPLRPPFPSPAQFDKIRAPKAPLLGLLF
jgi:hypothetical protein